MNMEHKNVGQRKYWVKRDWLFNLDSLYTRIKCIQYDIEDGTQDFPLEIAGTPIKDWDDLDKILHECDQLLQVARWGRVTGKEYGRIKTMVEYRCWVRYFQNVNAGMDEDRAALSFDGI